MINQQQTSLIFIETQKQILREMFIGGTASGSNVSANVGKSHGSSDRQWVDEVSSIVATEKVDVDVKGKLSMEGSVIANLDKDGKDAENLNIKAGSIETSDLQNFDRNKETGFSFAESYGPDKSGTSDGHPKGTTTIGLTNKGYEKEGVTQATIGKGNIETADESDVSGINRDVDNVNVVTKDQITGALDAKITVDNRMFTEAGRKEIVEDIKQIHSNMRDTSGNLVQTGQQTFDTLEDNKFNNYVLKPLITLYNAVVGAPGGVIATFDENRSNLYVNGEKITDENKNEILKNAKVYIVNGVMNTTQDVANLSLEDGTIVRYNPSYGFLGDLFEAGTGKIINLFSLPPNWIAMDRIVSEDINTRKDTNDVQNIFHSQGTIIGLGAGSLLNSDKITINNGQKYIAKGPAVSAKDWINVWTENNSNLKVQYMHNPGDFVRCLTTLDCIKDYSLLQKLFSNIDYEQHGIKSYNNQITEKDAK